MGKASHAHLNTKLNKMNLKFKVYKSFSEYLNKANPDLLRKRAYKIS